MHLEKFFYRNNKFFIILLDLLLISASFLILAWAKPETVRFILPNYTRPFIILSVIWLVISFILGKYDLLHIKKPIHLWIAITSITFVILSIVSILLFALKLNAYSRIIVFGTIMLCYILELITFRIVYEWLKLNIVKYDSRKFEGIYINPKETSPAINKEFIRFKKAEKTSEETTRKKLITRESGPDIYNYFSEHLNIESESTVLIDTATQFNIENIQGNNLHAIINLKKVNNLNQINNFFEVINSKLSDCGIFIGCIETKNQRAKRIVRSVSPFIKQIILIIDLIVNLVLKIHFRIINTIFNTSNKAHNSISKAEVLGRLVCCGFEVIEYKEINNLTYFVVMKTGEPAYIEDQPYGLIFKMPRIGKDGKTFFVYKFRTMYPYSEYLQDYVVRINGYSELGKPADDFRLTRLGKFMRKYWLDELPQLINVLRGEMKLFGIRPLSRKAFDDYPEDVKKMRVKYKPGCIPPYVALLKQGMSQSIEAERIYLLEKESNSFITDFKYFRMAVLNIITNKIRSA